jgi:hypothetical protein
MTIQLTLDLRVTTGHEQDLPDALDWLGQYLKEFGLPDPDAWQLNVGGYEAADTTRPDLGKPVFTLTGNGETQHWYRNHSHPMSYCGFITAELLAEG